MVWNQIEGEGWLPNRNNSNLKRLFFHDWMFQKIWIFEARVITFIWGFSSNQNDAVSPSIP